MLIRLKKREDGVVLACVRGDGETAVQRTGHGGFFAWHDLLHYAVESELGFCRGFFGLMAANWEFDQFTRRDDPRHREIPPEAILVEHLVGVMTVHVREPIGDDAVLMEILTEEINRDFLQAARELPAARPLTTDEVSRVLRSFEALSRQWQNTPIGETLELAWPDFSSPASHSAKSLPGPQATV